MIFYRDCEEGGSGRELACRRGGMAVHFSKRVLVGVHDVDWLTVSVYEAQRVNFG
jgi:hypothetical protein